MKRILAVVLLAAALPFSTLSQTTRDRAAERAVRRLLDESLSALVGGDDAALGRIYADDYTNVSPSGAVTTKAQRLAAVRAGELKYASAAVEESEVRVFGGAATAVTRLTVKAQERGRDVSGQYRVTTVLGRRGGRWQVLAEQSNRIARPQITPAADHHTHLYSEAAAAVYVREPLPSVALPPELERVLHDYERFQAAGDAAGIASLFTEDGLFPWQSGWLRGREAIGKLNFVGANFRLRATAYSVEGSVGYIAGFIGRASDPSVPDIARLVLALRRGPDGRWLIAARLGEGFRPPDTTPRTADRLVAELDAAGVRRATVLSVAFWFGDPTVEVADEYAKVRAENDWVAAQVARYPDRLVGFCGFNPLKDYALAELERCAREPNLKGVKLHFDNSGVDLLNPRHVERLRQIFRAADERRMPLVVHLWVRGGKYGRQYSEIFLNQIIPAAPDVPLQIAHLAASGPNYHADDALEVYAEAAAAGDPRMKNVYFDAAGIVTATSTPESLALVARRLRQLGLRRVLFGSDYSPGGTNETPKNAWESFLRLPLDDDEFRTVAENVAPYMSGVPPSRRLK